MVRDHIAAIAPEERPTMLPERVVFVTSVSRGIVGGIINYIEPLERGLRDRGVLVHTLHYPRTLNLMESRGLPKFMRAPMHVAFAVLCVLRILRLRRYHPRILVHSHG